jgi:hypothetical protein
MYENLGKAELKTCKSTYTTLLQMILRLIYARVAQILAGLSMFRRARDGIHNSGLDSKIQSSEFRRW